MAEGARLESVYTFIAYRGFESLSLRQIRKSPASRGFFVSDVEIGTIQIQARSARVRLLGRTAQEDVDEGDARRARAMDGPSQSLSF